jgi:serine protease
MKKYFGLFLVLFSISSTFAQKDSSKYLEGELYIRLKSSKVSTKFSSLNRISISKDLPSLNSNIKKGNFSVEKIEKSFNSAKNKDLKNIIRLKIKENDKIEELIEELKASGEYEYVGRIPKRTIIATPNDPSFSQQWSLTKIKATEAWDENSGAATVIVAVVDNSIQTNHPDLAANMLPGRDMSVDGDFDPNPPNVNFAHGTHVAGILSAVTNNAIGIAAAANNKVKILPIKATSDFESYNNISYGYEGIVWAVDNGAKIISCSWGGATYDEIEKAAIDYAYANGVIVVAAAGNDNTADLNYPAAYDHVISVASVGQTDVRSYFSSYGSKVDISAPGESILSTLPFGAYGSYSGTSMATPLVSSFLGYLLSTFPTITNAELENLMKSTSDDISSLNPGFENSLGSGRINLLNAVSCRTQNLDTLSLKISASRYFCAGDSAFLFTKKINGLSHSWYKDGTLLPSTTDSIWVNQPGVYKLKIQKGNCSRVLNTIKVLENTLVSSPSLALNKEVFYCATVADTLVQTAQLCSQPSFYEKAYSGGNVGYDNFVKSGADPTVVFSGIPGFVDSLEVSIQWQKKDGGNYNSCGNADGGSIPYNEEVAFSLQSPEGETVELIGFGTFQRGNTTSGLVTQIFKLGVAGIPVNSLPTSGTFSPSGDLTKLINTVPNGTWTLLPQDNSEIDPLCVSGFSIKIYTNYVSNVPSLSWWDSPTGGNKVSDSSKFILPNLSVGEHLYFAQSKCNEFCPSVRTPTRVTVKTVPDIVGFSFDDVILSRAQVMAIMAAQSYRVLKSNANLYYVEGLDQNGQFYSYQISNKGPSVSPVSVCSSVDYVLVATGCTGTVSWSNGETNLGIILENLNQNTQITASCNQTSACVPPPPSIFNFTLATSPQILTGTLSQNSIQSFYGSNLESTQKINPTSQINYKGTSSVELKPGFEVKQGNVFSAQIGNCNN